MVSIIIPAYNEESVIRRTLEHLIEGTEHTDLDIIVCCNGCRDRTAEIAREFGPPVRVLETQRGSMTLALNMGDEAAISYPRIYLDADILLNYATVKSIVQALSEKGVMAVAPRMKVNLSGRNWAIRAFYDVWLMTPYHQLGMIGSGVYALSKEGRSRFNEFPDIIADDAFVRAHFETKERTILEDCSFTVTPPAKMRGLLQIKTRGDLGIKELYLKYPELMSRAQTDTITNGRNLYWKILASPKYWPQITVFVFVKAVAALRARKQLKTLNAYEWERDETSRV